ncbi:hypothetical protein ANCDUO_05834 [Ancylostoma duodenale]|uniref:Uncharacterized protein n=1 Tax=Ancylostoma duodenale TaxID=51022 RepID=A0A0C2DMN7_9BILA|nr:hypothetical protein ANCDUO_05834 [Ancylostoma duodenale]
MRIIALSTLMGSKKTNKRRKEVRMSVQVVGLLVALFITCVHFCMQFFFNYNGMTDWVYAMRYFTPLWVGLLTFINPWMILIMNREVRELTLGRRSTDDTSSVHPMGRNSCVMMTTSKKRYSSTKEQG